MKISVVIPTYKRPKLLKRCLDALLNQQFDKNEFEVIVVSDGPDEETAQLATLMAVVNRPTFKFYQLPEKKGPAACRNLGWLQARGVLIAFTDDDCIPTANWLSSISNYYTGEEAIAFTGKVVVPRTKSPTDYELNTANLETAEFVTANCICTKKALLKVGGFDERFSMAWREDSDLHFKLISHQIPIYKVPATVLHPVRKAPWGISIKEQKKGIFNALLYKKYPRLYRERIKASPSWNYYVMVMAVAAMLAALFSGAVLLGLASFLIWLGLLISFIRKRLQSTSKSLFHIVEMVFTSAVIPFVSIFWQFYGALKYRVLFL
ncbi:glycosyltransferase family 2 protein [Pedobacter sp. SYSU D00535]|uniref:glycosyltransferase family 2 protein n=1 Tax=Pedobacter sp. SYSU D00535 TaxID=2810308 RepID=UPI001F608FF2|nr:glycosyltransferase [Pedobacter sp. SYSU D00535]